MRINHFAGMKTFTAIIRKGEKQFVALCPELDVVSQGKIVESALKNLKEAVELYIDEMGVPEGYNENEAIIARFTVLEDAKVA
jgi:predicted RNase H-like HicB family nuclease